MYLVGQEQNKELIDNNKIDNASFIMIKGPANYGKTYLTKYIAKHYGMDYILLDNKVDTIRDLVEISNRNNNCLYHFKDFDKSSPAAKAALLKIAEETPKGVKIVVTTSAYNFLETLNSRAYIIGMKAYSYNDINEYADNLGFKADLLDKMENQYHLELTPSLLYKYKDREDIEEIFGIVDETISAINEGLTLEKISKISNSFWKDDIDRVKIYLEILSKCSKSINKKYYQVIKLVEQASYRLNKIAINNYKQLIHNMLMEMV